MTRRIAVITGTRSEYGLLKPVMEALQERDNVEAGFIATGMHLQEKYGRTIEEIERDGFPVWEQVEAYRRPGNDFSEQTDALAAAIGGIGETLHQKKADIAVVLGDRLEGFAGASAAYFSRTVCAHLHGGEKSDYHMDDATRHAITRLSHLHFPATEESAERLKAMGEEPFRIHCFGAPGLDSLRTLAPPSKEEIIKKYNFSSTEPLVIFLFHPETSRWSEAGTQAAVILKAIQKKTPNILALYPNGDPGSSTIIETLKQAGGNVVLKHNLKREEFLAAFARADALVGNSSCGLIEGSFLGTPVLNAGERNKGREHGKNVLFRPITEEAIGEGLAEILTGRFREQARRAPCPWGDGTAGGKIAGTLAGVELGEKLRAKRITL